MGDKECAQLSSSAKRLLASCYTHRTFGSANGGGMDSSNNSTNAKSNNRYFNTSTSSSSSNNINGNDNNSNIDTNNVVWVATELVNIGVSSLALRDELYLQVGLPFLNTYYS